MQKKLLAWNTIASLLLQLTVAACGFVLPKLILGHFGSSVYGLVSSLTQFIFMIFLFDCGMNVVLQTAFYKPLVEHDDNTLSAIYLSADKFYTRLSYFFVLYIFALLVFYPRWINAEFDYFFTDTLILCISLDVLGQLYFGVVSSALITASQRGYICSLLFTASWIIYTVLTVVLIRFDVSIQCIKLVSSFVFLSKPVICQYYVRKHFNINYQLRVQGEPIQQKWNGLLQHCVAVLTDTIPVIALTLFVNLQSVSVYAVYFMVIKGVKQISLAINQGFPPYFGELWSKGAIRELREAFEWMEWLCHNTTILIFGCTAALLVPFIQVYTHGINDTNYVQPLLAISIVLAYGFESIRSPYYVLTMACNQFKQTQYSFLVTLILNVTTMFAGIKLWGIVGAPLGVFVSFCFQTIWLAYYNTKNLIESSMAGFFKQLLTDISIIGVYLALPISFELDALSYMSWFVLACKTFAIWVGVICIMNLLLHRNKFLQLVQVVQKRLHPKTV